MPINHRSVIVMRSRNLIMQLQTYHFSEIQTMTKTNDYETMTKTMKKCSMNVIYSIEITIKIVL